MAHMQALQCRQIAGGQECLKGLTSPVCLQQIGISSPSFCGRTGQNMDASAFVLASSPQPCLLSSDCMVAEGSALLTACSKPGQQNRMPVVALLMPCLC